MKGPAALPIAYADKIIALVVVPAVTFAFGIHRGKKSWCLLTFCMASDDGCDPSKKNHEGSENEDYQINVRLKQHFNTSIGLLEIQYENNRPTLLCEGSLLTRMDPSNAGTNMSAAAYPRPIARREATVTPSQMVRTGRVLLA